MGFLQFFRPCSLCIRLFPIFLRSGSGAAALLALSSLPAVGQNTIFIGIQTALPLSGVGIPRAIAFDSKGDLFVQYDPDYQPTYVMEYLATPSGYSSPITLPITASSAGFFLDKNDNLFAPEPDGPINELPKTAEGYGAQVTIPLSLHSGDATQSGAVDHSGNIFLVVASTGSVKYYVVELPKTESGYGSPIIGDQTEVNSGPYFPEAIAVDSLGNLFLAIVGPGDKYPFVELIELSGTLDYEGSLPPPSTGLNHFQAMALDSKGDLFITENGLLLEYFNTALGSEPLTFGVIDGPYQGGVAVDSSGSLFLVSEENGGQITKIDSHTPANFGQAYDCAGSSKPAPCSQTLFMSYGFNTNVTLGTPQVVSDGQTLDFTLSSAGNCSGSITALSSCSLTVTFAPQTAGTRSGAMEIVDSKGSLLTTTPITGLGISASDAPQTQASPSVLQFGTLPYGTSETLPVTITNIGGGALNVTSASINAKSFTISGNTCTAGLSSGQSCTLQVQFDPINIAAFSNTLTLKTNGTSTTSIVSLQAIGSGITVAGGPLEFGTVTYGASKVLNLTIANHWLSGAVTLQASASGPSYSVLQNAANTCTVGVVSGGVCNLPVQFAPQGVGGHDGILTLTPSGGGAPRTVTLDGFGGGLLPATPYLQFGSVPQGSTAVLPLTVTNDNLPATVGVDVTFSGPSYSVLDNSQNTCQADVAPGASCTLIIQFSPVGAGSHNGILTLTPSTGGTGTTVALDGQAAAPP